VIEAIDFISTNTAASLFVGYLWVMLWSCTLIFEN